VVVLGVLGVLFGTITAQMLTNHRALARQQDRMQCLWLARSGVELAAAKLLTDPAYKGESIAPIDDSRLRVTVTADKNAPNLFTVTSEAHFPIGDRHAVVERITRQVRRVLEKDRARIELTRPGSIQSQ
jgi:hypothetical protein